jgi:hypothetical protein
MQIIYGHNQKTQHPHTAKSREEKRALLYYDQLQKWRHKQWTNMRTLAVTALKRSVAKQFVAGGLNQVLWRTNLALAPAGSHKNKQVQVVLVK